MSLLVPVVHLVFLFTAHVQQNCTVLYLERTGITEEVPPVSPSATIDRFVSSSASLGSQTSVHFSVLLATVNDEIFRLLDSKHSSVHLHACEASKSYDIWSNQKCYKRKALKAAQIPRHSLVLLECTK